MRIVHVDTGREMRGGQRQVLLLLRELRGRAIDSVVLARRDSPLFRSAGEAGFAVYPAEAWELWRRSGKADLVHVHDARAHAQAALVSRVPFVVSRRVAFPLKRSPLSLWKYRRAARFLAVSRFVADELVHGGVDPGKIDVVHDGVECDAKCDGWRAGGPRVALASLDPAKGRDLLEEAALLAHLPVRYSKDLSLDLPGASMFIYVTRSEGLGSAALLAMAMGIPVIGSDVGGLSEALGFGEAGLLVPNEPHELAEAMLRLREDATLAATLIQRGKARVAAYFSAPALAQHTIESYQRALAG